MENLLKAQEIKDQNLLEKQSKLKEIRTNYKVQMDEMDKSNQELINKLQAQIKDLQSKNLAQESLISEKDNKIADLVENINILNMNEASEFSIPNELPTVQ